LLSRTIVIHFIVATNFEARPLIDFFKLKKKIHIEEFQIFNNEEISLTVSGIGKIFSALAVAHTYFQFGKKKNQIWINFGLAGHKNLKRMNKFSCRILACSSKKTTCFHI